jgi:hypothetical protein
MSKKDILFALRHPIAAFETKVAQGLVALGQQEPPCIPGKGKSRYTIEDFSELELSEAFRALSSSLREYSSGVGFDAWSPKDQNRMLKGERPIGYPEHWNI